MVPKAVATKNRKILKYALNTVIESQQTFFALNEGLLLISLQLPNVEFCSAFDNNCQNFYSHKGRRNSSRLWGGGQMFGEGNVHRL